MRPPLLNPLFASLSALPGIGPKLEKLFARLFGRDGEPPRLDRSVVPPAGRIRRPPQPAEIVRGDARHGGDRAVTVDGHRPPPPNRPRAPYNIDASDDTNTLTITYFNARQDYLEKLLPEGEAALRLRHRDASTTAICRCCIPTAWSMRQALPNCR